MKRQSKILAWLTSLRTTMLLFCWLSVLLLLNVALPQASLLGEAAFAERVSRSSIHRFFLEDLALGHLVTSPIFLFSLAVFLLHLAAVLMARIAPTFRRVTLRSRSEKGLRAWAAMDERLRAPIPLGWNAMHASDVLIGNGYYPRSVGDRTIWAVRHRTAPLGFLLFHMSFFLLFAGGIQLYYTRFVASIVLTEGQTFGGEFQSVSRQPPMGQATELPFRLERVEGRFEAGQPVHLQASLLFEPGLAAVSQEAWVNHPAHWGSATLLVKRAGISPFFRLRDESGLTIDRVAVAAKSLGSEPSRVPINDGELQIAVYPLLEEPGFLSRKALLDLPIRIQITKRRRPLFEGRLSLGESATWKGGSLVLEDIRYWAGIQVVDEKGGAALIAGFVLGVIGLIWRMMLHRKEVVVAWDEEELFLVGRSEYYRLGFEQELELLFQSLLLDRVAKSSRGTSKS